MLGKNETKQAAFEAERWHGPDRDEAIDLWDQIPEDKRSGSAPVLEAGSTEMKSAQGALFGVACGEKGGTTVILRNAKGMETFRSAGPTMIGFPDTLWYGADHFNLCRHIDGMQDVVKYKDSQNKELTGEWHELELRQPVPYVPPEPPAASADAKSQGPASPK